MNDNNLNKEDRSKYSVDKRRASYHLLNDLIVGFEEQLYALKIQLKSHKSLLKEKELELAEREKGKSQSQDLFSPIYIKNFDTTDIETTINQLYQKIEELIAEQEQLNNKISGLKCASEGMEVLIKESEQTEKSVIEAGNRQIPCDKGLSILEAQEIERQRIARDLHDTTVQNLTSLVHKTELCAKLIDIDSIRAKLELNMMTNTLKTSINDMRGIIYNLKPMTLDDLGLTVTVQRYANKLMDFNNLQVKVQTNDEVQDILPVIKLTLFRIIQEACNNVIKHANATMINIDINYDEHSIKVVIKDNGSGFNIEKSSRVNANEQLSSFGLSFIRERTLLLSGKLDMQSEKGKGTIITVIVPLTIYEEDKNE